MPSLIEIAEQAANTEILNRYGAHLAKMDREERARTVTEYIKTEKILTELLTLSNRPKTVPNLPMMETVHSADFKVLFPKVVTSVLQKPKEGNYIGQSMLSRTINVDAAVRIIEFNTMGPLRAFELAETQEAKEQDPSFGKQITEFRIKRYGLKLEFALDVIENSAWDIVALYMDEANNALRRKKEELIFTQFEARSVEIFDNSEPSTDKWTSGLASNGVTKNATYGHEDLIDMMAALAGNGYNPSDVLLHPLAWAIWAKDPFLRFQLLHQGGIGQTLGDFTGTDETMSAAAWIPFGVGVIVSPFVTTALNTNVGTGSATGGTFNYTSIYVIDRNNTGVVVMQRSAPRVVEWENPARDIRSMQFDERYSVDLINGGRGSTVAKNVKIAQNFAPQYTIRSVTAA
jgi:hypothetical protein